MERNMTDLVIHSGSKREIRKLMLAKRNLITQNEQDEFSRIIAERVISFTGYRQAELVFAYAGYGSEVKTDELILKMLQDGKRVALPCSYVEDGICKMMFYELSELSQLISGYKGILEPDPTVCSFVNEVPDMMLIPGVAFDERGNRVGYGKGFYDYYFAHHEEVLKVALAYEFQVINRIEAEEFDTKMDVILTQERIKICQN